MGRLIVQSTYMSMFCCIRAVRSMMGKKNAWLDWKPKLKMVKRGYGSKQVAKRLRSIRHVLNVIRRQELRDKSGARAALTKFSKTLKGGLHTPRQIRLFVEIPE